MRKQIFPLLLLLVLSGCIYTAEADLSTSKPSFIQSIDVDLDGDQDAYYLAFSPSQVDSSALSLEVARTLFIYPTELVVEPTEYTLDSNSLDFIRAKVSDLSEGIAKEDISCSSKVSFTSCQSEESCELACRSSVCKEQGLGGMLLDYKELRDERDSLVDRLVFLSSLMKEGDSTKDFSTALTELQAILVAMKNHPLIVEAKFCDFNADISGLEPYLGKIETSQKRANVLTTIEAKKVENTAVEVSLDEIIPPAISTNIASLSLSDGLVKESSKPLRISYPRTRISEEGKKFFFYAAEGNLIRENTPYEVWNQLSLNVRVVSIDLSFLDGALSSLSSNVYVPLRGASGFSLVSIGLTFGVVILVSYVLYELLLYFYRFIVLLRAKRPITYILRKAWGYASQSWVTDLLLGFLFLALALAVEIFVSKPPEIEALSYDSLISAMQKDPIGSSSMLLAVMASFFLSLALVDRVKRLLAGRDYDEAMEVPTPEKNLALWRQLRDAVENARDELEDLSKREMDVGQQLSTILAIPVDSLREDIFSNPDQTSVRDRIKENLEKVSAVLESIHHKSELAKENRAKWLAYIDKKVSSSDRLPLEALVSIPIEWRFWAVKEYMKEHPEKFLTLEGTVLVKRRLSPPEKAARFIEEISKDMEEMVPVAVIMEGKEVLSSKVLLKKRSLVLNLVAQLVGRMVAINYKGAFSYMSNHILYVNVFNNKHVILIVARDAFEKVSDRISNYSKLL